jgi:putative membrane protein
MPTASLAILGQMAGRAGRYGGHRPHWIGIVVMALLVALVVAGLVALIVWLSRPRHSTTHAAVAAPGAVPGAPPAPPALDARRILDERLARGEIDTDDYRARREALES